MEWRHSTGVDDRETSPSDERGVLDDEISGGPENEDRRHAAEEVSSSESDEIDAEEITTEDEEELWRRVERDGFPREEMEKRVDPRGFPEKRTLIQRQGCGQHHHITGMTWEVG